MGRYGAYVALLIVSSFTIVTTSFVLVTAAVEMATGDEKMFSNPGQMALTSGALLFFELLCMAASIVAIVTESISDLLEAQHKPRSAPSPYIDIKI